MFHISPKTGTPQICTAQPGACPYEHFKTYEEAKERSDEILMDITLSHKFAPLEAPTDPYHGIITQYGKDEIIDLLRTTEDRVLLGDVFMQRTSLGKNVDYFKAIVRNPNLPEYVENKLFVSPIQMSPAIFTEYTTGPLITRNWDTIDYYWTYQSPRNTIPDYIKHLGNYSFILKRELTQEEFNAVSRIFKYAPLTTHDIRNMINCPESVSGYNTIRSSDFTKPPFSSIFLNVSANQAIREEFEQKYGKITYDENPQEPLEFKWK